MKKVHLVLLLIILLLSGLTVWYATNLLSVTEPTTLTPQVQSPEDVRPTYVVTVPNQYTASNPLEELSGSLHITLADEEISQASDFLPYQLHTYDFESNSISQNTEITNIAYTYDSSPLGVVAYAALVPAISTTMAVEVTEPVTPQIFVKDEERITQLTTAVTSNDTPIIRKRLPQIANTDATKILFSQQRGTEALEDILAFRDLDNWDAILITGSSDEQVLAQNAAYPTWSKDDNFVFVIKTDGIYVIDVKDPENSIYNLWNPLQTGLGYGSQITISPDGEYLLLTDPSEDSSTINRLTVFKIEDNDQSSNAAPVALRTVFQFAQNDVQTIWPTISPEGRYLALQVIDNDPSNRNARVEIYDLTQDDVSALRTISLAEFDQNIAFLTDWTQ